MNDDVLSIDIESLRVREIEEIEDLVGVPFDKLFAPDAPKGKVLRALGLIVKRRENPDFTWEQAGDLVIALAPNVDPPAAG